LRHPAPKAGALPTALHPDGDLRSFVSIPKFAPCCQYANPGSAGIPDCKILFYRYILVNYRPFIEFYIAYN
ncbi:MAG: hypothetical protein ACLRSJ_04485, partial [Agathobaculum sp.]